MQRHFTSVRVNKERARVAELEAEILRLRARIAELEARQGGMNITDEMVEAAMCVLCAAKFPQGWNAVVREAITAALAVAGHGLDNLKCRGVVLGAGTERSDATSNALAPSVPQDVECERCNRLWSYLKEAHGYADEHGLIEMRDLIDVLRHREC